MKISLKRREIKSASFENHVNPGSCFCKVVNKMDFACLEMSILELWANDGKYDNSTDEVIASLTNQDVLDKLNSFNK